MINGARWWEEPAVAWRALTIQAPWDLAIVVPAARSPLAWWSVPLPPRGPLPVPPKLCENRVWSTTWRGPLLIHSGKGWDRRGITDPRILALSRALFPWDRYVSRAAWTWSGHITAAARLVDVHPADGRCCPDWGAADQFHFILEDVRVLTIPVEATGRLRLWRPRPDLVEQVRPLIQTSTGAPHG